MFRIASLSPALVVVAALAASQPARDRSSPAETQPGAAADLNRPPQAGGAACALQRSAVGRRSEEVAARGARRRRRGRRSVLRTDGMGDDRQSPGRDLRDRGRDRRSGERVARQPGDREGQGLHRQRLQHRRDAAVDGAALHADAARSFAVGRRRAESVSRRLPGRARATRTRPTARSAAARSPSAAACRSTRARRASAASASAATRPAPITRSPSAFAISRSSIPRRASSPTTSSSRLPTVRRRLRIRSAPTPGATGKKLGDEANATGY